MSNNLKLLVSWRKTINLKQANGNEFNLDGILVFRCVLLIGQKEGK